MREPFPKKFRPHKCSNEQTPPAAVERQNGDCVRPTRRLGGGGETGGWGSRDDRGLTPAARGVHCIQTDPQCAQGESVSVGAHERGESETPSGCEKAFASGRPRSGD
ncbi:hypothetical protein NDU88_000630 [Pleurodeles waltl]|uniref:Uncharacterized protein n=1 Tax=Pleurodeles waltl TaxID=8319 RepID=A0AAV7R4Q3_PLEWA|nr:hypothetical protein NDU88_000630 [Pleurodeles waltl]